jgi:hypothetical protein
MHPRFVVFARSSRRPMGSVAQRTEPKSNWFFDTLAPTAGKAGGA